MEGSDRKSKKVRFFLNSCWYTLYSTVRFLIELIFQRFSSVIKSKRICRGAWEHCAAVIGLRQVTLRRQFLWWHWNTFGIVGTGNNFSWHSSVGLYQSVTQVLLVSIANSVTLVWHLSVTIRKGKPTPSAVCTSAVFFCLDPVILNRFKQVINLCNARSFEISIIVSHYWFQDFI